jgi:hypothetical protein
VREEIGRWSCDKCGKGIVVVGERLAASFKGTGSFTGACPWECGAWINRGFRRVRSGGLAAFRADEFDASRVSS